jgi:hypothetical protein
MFLSLSVQWHSMHSISIKDVTSRLKLYKENHVTNSVAHVSQEARDLVYRWSRNSDFMELQNVITIFTAYFDAVMHQFSLTHTFISRIRFNIIFHSAFPLPVIIFL